jgi:SAM-dependent methyltransferase
MSYDWRDTSRLEPGTAEWFDEIDRRFFADAHFAQGAGAPPFSRFLAEAVVRDRDVLEVGCGMGTHAALLAGRGARLTAVDLTEPAVKMTTRRLALRGLEGQVLQADAERLPFPDASFDLVWSWGVMHHSLSFERCVLEAHRVLRPGGRLVLMVYHRHSLFYYLHQGLVRGILLRELRDSTLPEIYHRNIDGAYARLFTRAELAQILGRWFSSAETFVAGSKSELLPIPAGRIKARLVGRVPDGPASAVLDRAGFFLMAEARR